MELLSNYDIEDIKYDFGDHPVKYTKLFLNDTVIDTKVKEDVIKRLLNKDHYLRFFGKQDNIESRAYIMVYIRDTSKMLPGHFNAVCDYLLSMNANQFLIEVNYAKMAHFFIYDMNNNTAICLD
jgi:hypothetical protein